MYEPIKGFRKRLENGETLVGTTIVVTDPIATDAIAESVDFLWFDLEHTSMSHEALRNHLIAARGKGCPGIVRVTQGSTAFVKPVLDAGASGVIAPQIRTVKEVEQLVTDCRYTPMGERGVGPLIPTNYTKVPIPQQVEQSNSNILTAIMIETAESVEIIDEIVAVPGLDSIVIGPMDLSGSLGVLGNLEHPEVVNAMNRVITSATDAGVYVGAGLGLDASYGLTLANRGVKWLQMGCDILAMIDGINKSVTDLRDLLEQ